MAFLISLALALVLVFTCAEQLKKRPTPFYLVAAAIAVAVIGCALTDVPLSPFVKTWVWPVIARGALAGALFVLVMVAGAFPNGSAGARRLMPIRGQLSILACILTLAHNIAYGKTYFKMLFFEPGRLPLTQQLASVCSIIMIVIMLPLFVTSFPAVRRKMDGKRWKKLQRLAYGFYALLCAHILLLTIPYAINGRSGYRLTVFIYTAIFVTYAFCRVQKAFAKDKRVVTNRHAGVVCGLFAAALVMGMTFGGTPQTASAAVPDAAASVPAAVVEQSDDTPDSEVKAAELTETVENEPPAEDTLPDAQAEPLEPSETQPEAPAVFESAEAPVQEPAPAAEDSLEPEPIPEPTPAPEPEPQPEPEPVSVYRDGVYTGTGMGFEGPITVSVTIQGDRIVSVQVLSQSEDEPFWTDSLVVLDRIVSAQSPDVDAVSEATSSCHGIMDAVRQALQSAKNE